MKKLTHLIALVLALPLLACDSPTRDNEARHDRHLNPTDAAVLPDSMPAQEERAPLCFSYEELLDGDGRLNCPEGAHYTDELGDEECRADPTAPVLIGPGIRPGERILPHHGPLGPSWWVADGLMVICDEAGGRVEFVSDLNGGCWVRCWVGFDGQGRCLHCVGALTCVPCEGL